MKIFSLIITFITIAVFQIVSGQQPMDRTSAVMTCSQSDAELCKAVKLTSEEAGKALMAGDYEKLFNLTHPKIREFAGGKKNFIAVVSDSMKSVADKGFKVVAMEAREPDKISTIGDRMFAAVPVKLRMQSPDLTIVKESFDIAVSDDNGKTWTLIGGGNDGKEIFLKLFPEAIDKLVYPEEKAPYPYKEQ